MDISIEGLDGLDQVAGALHKASVTASTRVEDAVRQGADDVERWGKAFSPVRTGAMRESIHAEVKGATAVIGPTPFYSKFVEFGTSRAAPFAFMGPALDRATPDFVTACEEAANIDL